jgi:hypothetical protein
MREETEPVEVTLTPVKQGPARRQRQALQEGLTLDGVDHRCQAYRAIVTRCGTSSCGDPWQNHPSGLLSQREERAMIFRRLLAVPCLLALGCGYGARKPVRYPGLGQEDVQALHALIAIEAPEAFEREVIRLRQSGEYRSVLVLTHAMIELPWIPELEPKHRSDFRMRKVIVEYYLDQLVAAPLHDRLSAAYFRAVTGREGYSVEETKRALLEYTIENRIRLEWRDGRFAPFRGK